MRGVPVAKRAFPVRAGLQRSQLSSSQRHVTQDDGENNMSQGSRRNSRKVKAKEAGSERKGNGSPEASKLLARTLNSSFDGDKKSLVSTLENSHFSSKRASRRYNHIHKKQNFMPPSY